MKNIYKFKDTSKLAVKFAKTLFLFLTLYSISIVFYSIYKIYIAYSLFLEPNAIFYIFSSVLGAIFTILFLLCFKLNNENKVNFSIVLSTIIICISFMEIFLEYKNHILLYKGLMDNRNKIEVIDDLNKKDIESYPHIFPALFIDSNGLDSENGKIYPLGGISNITSVICNENGYWLISKTDEKGFHNSKGLYKNNLDIMMVGDSYTLGACVKPDEFLSNILSNFGFKTISFGKSSNGPLLELAALKEYAKPLEPKVLLWMYNFNDLYDLSSELKSSLLRKYLYEDGYSQNLIERQGEIDFLLKRFVKEKLIKMQKNVIKGHKEERGEDNFTRNALYRMIKLSNIRFRFNLNPKIGDKYLEPIPEKNLLAFKSILEKSDKIVREWGGTFYFVYLPGDIRFNPWLKEEREMVLNIVNQLNIPIIDILPVFKSYKYTHHLYPVKGGHFSFKGYSLVAETISKRLKMETSTSN